MSWPWNNHKNIHVEYPDYPYRRILRSGLRSNLDQAARTERRCILATELICPCNPSAADRQIAARASMQEMKAMQELQTAQLAASNTSSPGFIDQEKSASPDDSVTDNAQKTPASESHIQEPSKATRAIMSAAYKVMASFA